MRKKKGYTSVELVIVMLIVSILSAAAVPIMRGRINTAKWSEGKAIAGSIATAIRSWSAEANTVGSWARSDLPPTTLGFNTNDLDGSYFKESNFDWQVAYDGIDLSYPITITPPDGIGSPEEMTLDDGGKWN